MAFTPPVSKYGFAYAFGRFYAEVSNNNQHHRATISELNALFHPSGTASRAEGNERVGHWYEAQLIHYGLAPSKNKAVAKSRLLDALNRGVLVVPIHIRKIEEELTKEWLKKDRAARKEDKTSETKSTPNIKRKRDEKGVTLSSNMSTNIQLSIELNTPTKRTKPTVSGGIVSGRPKALESGKSKSPATPKRNTQGGAYVRGRGYTDEVRAKSERSVRRRGTPEETPTPSMSSARSRTKQTAPRSGGLVRGRDAHIKREEDLTSEFEYYPKAEDSDEYGPPPTNSLHDRSAFGPMLQPLGLINGLYMVRSSDLNQWPRFCEESNFNITLCLHGSTIWGSFDFGMHEGIIHLPQRPPHSSYTPIPFSWRGRENGEGEMSFGPHNHGWIRFLGGGKIEGMINCYGEAKFTGERVSGNETRAPRSAFNLQGEWEEYNEDAYERARVGRWGKSSYWR